MTDIRYSDAELFAFSIADKYSDDMPVSKEDILKAILGVAHSSYQARKQLDRAMWGLIEKNKAKRENIKRIIEMEQSYS